MAGRTRQEGATTNKQAALTWLADHVEEARRFCRNKIRYERWAVEPDEVIARAWEMMARRPDDAEWLDDAEVEAKRRLKYAYLDLIRARRRDAKRESVLDDHDGRGDRQGMFGWTAWWPCAADAHVGHAAPAVLRELQRSLAAADDERTIRAIAAAIAYVNLAVDGRLELGLAGRHSGWLDQLGIAAAAIADPALRPGEGPDGSAVRQRRKRLLDRMRDHLHLAAQRAGLDREDLV